METELSRQTRGLATRHGTLHLGARTALMGIVNVTPDSFSDGGRYFEAERAIEHGIRLVEDGVDLIDIGGESTRPGARPLGEEEEMERVLPVVRGLRRAVAVPLSIDTYKSRVARAALDEGADLVNDISALRFDPEMVSVVAAARVPVVLMHMQGTPLTMQQRPSYRDVVKEVKAFLAERVRFALAGGLSSEWIVIDPGFGFGKELDHNLSLLRGLSALAALGYPILVGPSRKAFIGKILGVDPSGRLEGSLAAAVAAVLAGANMVRMHDAKEARRALAIADALRYGSAGE
jgi:dihydropteroate synthase